MRLIQDAAKDLGLSALRHMSFTYRYADLVEQGESLAHVDQRDLLRSARCQRRPTSCHARRDNDRAIDGDELAKTELNVASAGRHVDDQHVEIGTLTSLIPPRDFEQELLDSLRLSGASRCACAPS